MKTLQISSSGMPFFHEQVRILRQNGVDCDVLYTQPLWKDGYQNLGRITSRLHGHNAAYYALRALRLYPRILHKSLTESYDVVHINGGMVAPLGFLQHQRPIVLTLWGDDLLSDRLNGHQSEITKRCAERSDEVIVRSEEMAQALTCKPHIIPSGTDLSRFRPIDRADACRTVGWDDDRAHVVFPYPKSRTKKRYPVAKEVVEEADARIDRPVDLQVIRGVSHEEMNLYYNAADALLLPSLREGSPNTVKEAMACNLPVVSTDVGDVRERLGPVANSYVCAEDSELVEALCMVLESGERSNGREFVEEVSLERMGERIIEIYESLLDTPQKASVRSA
jgi:teichuronic acid biosynthesis glycosyltransferase TuaC